MTWRALHNYGGGTLQLVADGARRPPTSVEAREIARELERFAALAEDATVIARADTGIPPADPDVDIALFDGKTHDVVAVLLVEGGSRLQCMTCKITGTRTYQDTGAALAYARMLSGPRVGSWPACTKAPT